MEEKKSKKGRTPAILDFKFHKILPSDFEDMVRHYLQDFNELYYKEKIYPIFSKIYFFYEERKFRNKNIKKFKNFIDNFVYSKEEFIQCLHNFTQEYIEYEEINVYYYLRYKLNDLFDCEDKTRYFDDREEVALKLYITSEDQNRKNIIYEKFLKHPFEKLVENIINTYKLHPETYSFEEILTDTVSFLHSKLEHFDPNYGTKGYSYLGTIAKHQLQTIKIREAKNKKRYQSFEDYYTFFQENEKYSYEADDLYEKNFLVEFCQKIPAIFQEYIDNNELNENEIKIGNSIVDIINNWSKIEGISNKINKNIIFECIRNRTSLTTKEIREGLKVFKMLYKERKKETLDKEYNPMD